MGYWVSMLKLWAEKMISTWSLSLSLLVSKTLLVYTNKPIIIIVVTYLWDVQKLDCCGQKRYLVNHIDLQITLKALLSLLFPHIIVIHSMNVDHYQCQMSIITGIHRCNCKMFGELSGSHSTNNKDKKCKHRVMTNYSGNVTHRILDRADEY